MSGSNFIATPFRYQQLNPFHRIYALSDTHGRMDIMRDSLKMITADLRAFPLRRSQKAELLSLGDLIDKGTHSRGVINTFLQYPHAKTTCLMGNHEGYLIDFLNGPLAGKHLEWKDQTLRWLRFFKGAVTPISYGVAVAPLFRSTTSEICDATQSGDEVVFQQLLHLRQQTIENIKSAGHWHYYEELLTVASWRHFVFCHAQINPQKDIQDHTVQEVITGRDIIKYTGTFKQGAVVIHGHSSNGTLPPILKPNSIGIDPWLSKDGTAFVCMLDFSEALNECVVGFLSTHGRSELTPYRHDVPLTPNTPEPMNDNDFLVRARLAMRKRFSGIAQD